MIFLFKGDSADERFGREIKFNLDIPSSIDTTGCSVVFSLNGIVASAILSNGEAVVSLTAEQTKAWDYGVGYASLALSDGSNIRTVTNTLAVSVTDSVKEMDDATNTIDITIPVGWEEALKGVSWDAGGTIGSLRDFLSRVGAVLGATVTTR